MTKTFLHLLSNDAKLHMALSQAAKHSPLFDIVPPPLDFNSSRPFNAQDVVVVDLFGDQELAHNHWRKLAELGSPLGWVMVSGSQPQRVTEVEKLMQPTLVMERQWLLSADVSRLDSAIKSFLQLAYTREPIAKKLKATQVRLGQERKRSAQLAVEHEALMQVVQQCLKHPPKISFGEPLIDTVKRYLARVNVAFLFDKDERYVMEDMANIFLIGAAFQYPNNSSADRYGFNQLEWVFHSSSRYSVAAAALCLTQERSDGKGPQKLAADMIPPVSIAFKLLLTFAETKTKFNDDTIALRAFVKHSHPIANADDIQRFIHAVNDPCEDDDIDFVAPQLLQAGMTVMSDVRNEQGVLLLAKHTQLTEKLITALTQYNWINGIKDPIAIRPFQPATVDSVSVLTDLLF